ncbi:hypothetical protein DFJ58DRAFT_879597 [Suillus subalutaceus]|uniref:uncharacterized protein n=1 Tax=Suillus subalutaceus TaxID=48586 RepID=UPI001B87AE74|nr:uncharacterized protein DFJ58DRAFT_879597 [Suillus subalutaceus]KAG1856371.1 hypothetical protein DFJ58DRAFT_879597 [Suillus subalutaceus]
MAVSDKSLRSTRNHLYPIQAWYCIGLFIFIIATFQWISFLHSKFVRRRQTSNASDPEQASVHHRHAFSWRRIPLGLVNAYRVISFRWTLEFGKSYTLNMAEVFVTMAYIIFLLYGHLSTLNYVHRMMARVVFILLLVHAGSEVVRNAPFQPYFAQQWLVCGLTSMVAFTILCIVSLRPIRAQTYELFFYVHFAMALIFLIGAYVHTQNFAVAFWIYPCFAIWGLDRLIRFLRLVVFNHSYFGFRSGSTMDATAEVLSDDFVRLRFHRPSHFHWTPGQTAYLIMPSVSRLPFEAHPFTIASFNSTLFDVPKEQKPTSEKHAEIGLAEGNLGSSVPFWKELVFFINVREGFTARLKDAALKGDKIKVFVDGPYGPSPNLASYDTSVLVAGGSGVSYALPVLLDIIEYVGVSAPVKAGAVVLFSSGQFGVLIIFTGSTMFLSELSGLHLLLYPSQSTFTLPAVATTTETSLQSFGQNDDATPVRNDSRSETVELQDGKDMEMSNNSLFAIESVKLAHGRPDLRTILRDEVKVATGRMSVSVCGSQSIARSVRGALRFPVSSPLSVANGGPSVTLHIESFGYA